MTDILRAVLREVDKRSFLEPFFQCGSRSDGRGFEDCRDISAAQGVFPSVVDRVCLRLTIACVHAVLDRDSLRVGGRILHGPLRRHGGGVHRVPADGRARGDQWARDRRVREGSRGGYRCSTLSIVAPHPHSSCCTALMFGFQNSCAAYPLCAASDTIE